MSANGKLTANELVTVEDDDQLNRVAAYWFGRARAAWYAAGGSGSCIVERAGAYRSYQVQHAMKYGIPSYAYWNLNAGSKVGLAAPGSSTHGTGNRFDATAGFNAFLLRRGGEFGMVREFGAADPNHWKVTRTTIPAGDDVAPLPDPEPLMEDTMPRAIESGNELAVIDPLLPNGYRIVKNTEPLYASEKRLYSPTGDGALTRYDDPQIYLGILAAATLEATRVQANLKNLLPAGGGSGVYAGPSAQDIATEVIRQQKLPGN